MPLSASSPSHAPEGYDCPFCRLVAGGDTSRSGQDDVVHRGPGAVAFVAGAWWPANPGHVLVVPTDHVENLYDLDRSQGADLHDAVRLVALALKAATGCEGVSTRQPNEPAGGQDVWHHHVHVFPRWTGDRLYERHRERAWADPSTRASHAAARRLAVAALT